MASAPSGDVAQQNAWSNVHGTFERVLLHTTLTANSVYTLTVDVGARSDLPFPGAAIDLGFGSTPGSDLLASNNIANTTPPPGGWNVWQSTFTTGPSPTGLGQALRIDLVSNGVQTQFDNVRLSVVPLPEPSVPLQVSDRWHADRNGQGAPQTGIAKRPNKHGVLGVPE